MPCWVVPSIAAELWGLSLDLVLARIADGSLASTQDCGFTVVDAAPWGHVGQPPRPTSEPPPPTFVAISADTIPAALTFEQFLVAENPPPPAPLPAPEPAEEIDAELPPLCEEEDDKPIGNWREVRSRTARVRRPPPMRAAPLAA